VGWERESSAAYAREGATSTIPHRLSFRDHEGPIERPTFLIFLAPDMLRLEPKVPKKPGVFPPHAVTTREQTRCPRSPSANVNARDRASDYWLVKVQANCLAHPRKMSTGCDESRFIGDYHQEPTRTSLVDHPVPHRSGIGQTDFVRWSGSRHCHDGALYRIDVPPRGPNLAILRFARCSGEYNVELSPLTTPNEDE
jgi:hypothetical protein